MRLLQRSTRRFAVTDVGNSVYRHAQSMLAEAQAAHEVVDRLSAEPRGVIRVSVPVGFQLSTAALMIALFKILGLRRWTVAVGAATATVVMAWVVFRLWLQVQLPAGILALG